MLRFIVFCTKALSQANSRSELHNELDPLMPFVYSRIVLAIMVVALAMFRFHAG